MKGYNLLFNFLMPNQFKPIAKHEDIADSCCDSPPSSGAMRSGFFTTLITPRTWIVTTTQLCNNKKLKFVEIFIEK